MNILLTAKKLSNLNDLSLTISHKSDARRLEHESTKMIKNAHPGVADYTPRRAYRMGSPRMGSMVRMLAAIGSLLCCAVPAYLVRKTDFAEDGSESKLATSNVSQSSVPILLN